MKVKYLEFMEVIMQPWKGVFRPEAGTIRGRY